MTPPTERTAPARFEALASSIARRPLRVAWGDGPSWCDGRTIALDPAHADRARDVVVVHAALLFGGALAPEVVRPLRGRARATARHLAASVPTCLDAVDAVLRPSLAGDQGWLGTIRPAKVLAAAGGAEGGSGAPPSSTADAIEDLRPPSEDDEVATRITTSRSTDPLVAPSGRRRRGRRAARRVEEQRNEGASGQAASRALAHSHPVRLVETAAGPIAVDDPPGRPGAVALLPEWDIDRRAYRPDWCAVHEVPIVEVADAGRADAASSTERVLRQRLAALRLDLAATRRQPDGHDLDLDALVEHRCRARAGDRPTGNVHIDRRRLRRDLGVLVLVDTSRSTGNPAGDGESVLHHHQVGAAALLDAFESLGDRVACHGFRSHGRRRVELQPVKRFDQRFDLAARARLGSLRSEGFTRLGAAVRHSADLLRDGAGTRRWLLVVLSDGFPFDLGYEGRHAAADSHHALAEARRTGVGALCLSIGADTPDHDLRAVFGATTFAAAPSISELEADLGGLVRAALAGADRSRRLTPTG